MAEAKRKLLLIVEDDPDIQLLLRTVLVKAGYEVAGAVDAMQGLMMARHTPPDLIILDIMIPAGGGASVYQRIRQMNALRYIPIVVYSALSTAQIKEKIPGIDDSAIVNKPASPMDVLAAIQKILPQD